MVLTRGHKDGDDEKSPLPPRECKRSNRGNLLETVDEIIWDSDDNSSQKSTNIKENNNHYTGHLQTRRSSGAKVKSEKIRETNEKAAPSMPNNMEAESDSDGELFVQNKNPRRQTFSNTPRNSRHRDSAVKNEFTLNSNEISDDNEKSDNENGLRRSTRRRTESNKWSWLVGPKTLRGYPNMIVSSEAENDEPRAAQKPKRFANRNNSMQQFRKLKERSSRYIHSPTRNHRPQKSRRNTRYSQEFHQDDDFDEDDEEGCKKNIKQDPEDLDSTPQTDTAKKSRKQMYTRPRRMRAMKVQYDEDTNSSEHLYPSRFLSSRSGRFMKRQKEEQIPSESENTGKEEKELEDDVKEHKEENSDIDSKKTERIKHRREPVLNDLKNGYSPSELPNKRMRKPVSRLSYEVETRHRKKTLSSASSSSSESSDDEDRQQTSQGRSRYSLRQNRKPISMKDPFEALPSHRHGHKTALPYLHSPARKHLFDRKQKATHARDDTSSSSDEKAFEKRKAKSMNKARNRCFPVNMKPEDLQMTGIRDRKVGSSLADIDPMSMDKSVTFESIGGLTQHIKALKEMILFPIMYPEVFQKFGVSPPRGVLFYGPPGTGKTLVARALANECSHDDRKIAFFMRKGADCLSKWVGESERQLRLLFDQAYQMRPSIIFFDEIDGLAPVRSSRQDQIHSSIVSTLLALLDGVDSRGEIVVIGATNRIDAIDPALRRPGRFDREFHFPLPSVEARKQIIKINTEKWEPKPTPTLLKHLAEQTVGYCGADIKSLCGESALVALRTRYPQIYTSKQKLLLDVDSIQVKLKHFMQCITKIVPAGQRAANAPGRKLDKAFEPLLQGTLNSALSILKKSFPHGFQKNVLNTVLHRPRLLLVSEGNQGQTTLLAPAILHALERIPTHRLDFPSLFSVAARAPEEACAQIFHEAKRNVPSILYVPLIDHLWSSAGDSVKSTFLYLLNDLESSVPVLFLATVEDPHSQLDPEIRQMFSSYRGEIFVLSSPTREQRKKFFYPIFYHKLITKPKPLYKKRPLEVLPLAPPPQPRQLKEDEVVQLEHVEEASLRELRIFLRQICSKLAKNKMFYIFTKPVDLHEVQDYLDIITRPMDLETMMSKIDLHQYECAQDFLIDIEQIVANALEYNPDRNPEDKLIRHRACTLRDTAYAYIKAEMDTDFEDKCRDIRKNRKKRKRTPLTLPPHFMAISQTIDDPNIKVPSGTSKPTEDNGPQGEENRTAAVATNGRKRKRRSNWSRGMVASKKKRIDKDKSADVSKEENDGGIADSTGRVEDCDLEDEKSETSRSKTTDSDTVLVNGHLSTEEGNGSNKVTSALDSKYQQCLANSHAAEDRSLVNDSCVDTCDTAVSSSEQSGWVSNVDKEITVDIVRIERLYDTCVCCTEGVFVEDLHHLYSRLSALCKRHQASYDRNPLVSEMELEIQKFQQCHTNEEI